MKLRHLGKTALTALITTFSAATMASAQEMKLADFLPPSHPFQTEVYGAMADKIAAATDGEVTIQVYPGGALGGNPVEQYERALNGVADIAFIVPGYTASKFPMTTLLELPTVVENTTATARINDNLKFLSKEYKRVHLLSLFSNSASVLYTRNTPVRGIDDVKGMKIRVPSRNAGLVVESWGAVPVSMPGPDAYNAMQTGVIDGILGDAAMVYGARWIEIANYITEGLNASILPMGLIMNRDAYDDLSEANKAALDKIGQETAFVANKVQLDGHDRAKTIFSEAEGKEWIELSAEAIASFDAASAPVVEAAIASAEADGHNARAFVEALTQ